MTARVSCLTNVLLLVACAAHAQPQSDPPPASSPRQPGARRTDPLEPAFRLVREAVERNEVPGAIALVARDGVILRHEAHGLRDLANQLPFTTNTLCWIASITKPVTVAAAMTLVDAGKLSLDDPVENYLPEFREQKDTNGVHHTFTICHLMSHTSGLVPNPPTRRSGWPIGGPLDDFWLQQNLPDIVQTIAASQLRFKPGSKFEYSNSAFFVLGRVIEVISGRSYAIFVKENILQPLGMSDTHYAPPSAEAGRVARIYAQRDGKRETIFTFNPSVRIVNHAPDGGLFSSPAQLVPFLQMFLQNDGRVLSQRAVAQMLEEQPHGWGLGWSLSDGLFMHEGSSGTLAWADPRTDVIGILFLQYRDQKKSDERLRNTFRQAVREAFNEPEKPDTYFPPPESQGGWRKLENAGDIRRLAGMDPDKLAELKQWLLESDKRDFAAVVVRNGYIALEVERGNSAKTDSRRVASVSKAIAATVLAIASEQSQQGQTPKKMTFDDPAFDFLPWAKPLSDPRKERVTIRQLLNHTSGICPEATGAPNDGRWDYVLGHSGDDRTAKLAFDPGAGCGYSTHALAHAALVCETVTGQPYDRFAIEALFKPIGIEHWWFQFYEGGEKYGRHPSHGMGMPARDLARIAYCMLRGGRWKDQQVVPKWFVEETAAPTHTVTTPEMRWKLNPQIFSHGWELPARLTGEGGRSGNGIPTDARAKPGSGGQYIAFVPSVDLVVTRQTGSSGEWQFEEYLRRACQTVLGAPAESKLSNGPALQRGLAQVKVTRPKNFPHRIWAACDFEARTPDYGWFGPAETNNLPRYPGNATALGVSERPYKNFSAIMTGINPVPGPRMGKVNYLYLRYHLLGGTEATFQHFSLTSNDNNHIRMTGLTEGVWSEVTMNFTRDGQRNDGTPGVPFKEGERMDDLKIFAGKPGDGKRHDLVIDDVIFFANDPDLPPESEPFPNRVILLAAFDTGPKEKYWPGEFEIVEKDLPAGSHWRVARAVPRKNGRGKLIRLQIDPVRAVGAHTKLRCRYYLTGSRRMTVQIFDLTDRDNRHIHLRELQPAQWQTIYLDFTKNARRNDGGNTPFAAGHQVDDLFFFVQPDGEEPVELLIDEVVLFDAGEQVSATK